MSQTEIKQHDRSTRLTTHTLPKGLPPRTINQEVFQDEPAFANMKRPTTLPAGEFLVRQSLIRFEAHELVLRAAVRALERPCFGEVLVGRDIHNLLH